MTIINELLYKEYFGLAGVLGNSFDAERFFEVTADLFCVKEEEREALYRETLREIVAEIRNLEEYSRYKRIKEYEEMQGHLPLCDEQTGDLITIKGEAFKAVSQYKLGIESDATDAQITFALTEHAYRGNVVALRVLGLLECEEIEGYDDGKEKGIGYLTKAARWGDLTAALALLRYDEENRADNARLLAAILQRGPYNTLVKRVESRYGVSLKQPSPEVTVIKNAIANNKIDPLHYDAGIGRIAFSKVLSIEDKKKVIYTGNPALISEVCELPVGLHVDELTFDKDAFKRVPLDFSEVADAICTNLANADLRDRSLYLPLCLSTESDYASGMTAELMGELFKGSKVIKVDAKTLKPRDLVRGKNNVFLRDLSRTENNVMLFVMDGKVDEGAVEEIADFLNAEKRADFTLEAPAITIDLSSVLPVLVCNRENARKFSEETELVELPSIDERNLSEMIGVIFGERKKAFGLDALVIAPEAADLLATLPIDLAESVIDRTLRAYRAKGSDTVVTESAVRGNMKGIRGKTFGFGGSGYDEN